MATLRGYILSQSTLATGNTVRDHVNNPASIGEGGTVYVEDFSVEVDTVEYTIEVD